MLLLTTPQIEGKKIVPYYGLVSGETIIGANVFKNFYVKIRDVIGGRVSTYEDVLRKAKEIALNELQKEAEKLGANAVVGMKLDYKTLGRAGNNMLMVTTIGTAVLYEEKLPNAD